MRNDKGLYVVKGKSYSQLQGKRVQVHRGVAYKTSGGLTKKDIIFNKRGRYVSLKKHKTAKKEKRLEKAGYKTEKGKFGSVKVGKSSGKRKTKGKRKTANNRR